MKDHKTYVISNFNTLVWFSFWGLSLSCDKVMYEFWKDMKWWERSQIYWLTIGDLLKGRCSYQTIQGKKCLIYKDKKYARL